MAQHPGKVELNRFLREVNFDKQKFAVVWKSLGHHLQISTLDPGNGYSIGQFFNLFEESSLEGKKTADELIRMSFEVTQNEEYWFEVLSCELSRLNPGMSFADFVKEIDGWHPEFDQFIGRPRERTPAIRGYWQNHYDFFQRLLPYLLGVLHPGARGPQDPEYLRRLLYGLDLKDSGVVRTWDDVNRFGR